MTEYGTWVPYAGIDAILLAVGLLAIGLLLMFLGTRLRRAVGVRTPGRAVGVFLILIWGLSLATFLVAVVTYGLQLYQLHMVRALPRNPISPITALSGIVTFLIIAYLTRGHGLKLALGSALVGTAAAQCFSNFRLT